MKQQKLKDKRDREGVAPRAGAWVETGSAVSLCDFGARVAPRAGAWVETSDDHNLF